ncbi:protein FAR1-RELATED SEQUENCE 5-like [Camellia sinensis]|uniref:protein FAR1-RELATED SEQUENCE 5-like n=1 Tax=Camellia sinensis TaxID=4442 RepID=UPI001036C288|nr:protein FAR1-RELATED SEQUENCE 5-like [Camellia sinensis]
MIANSEDEAYNMYNEYAYHKGFCIRRDEKTYKRGTTQLIRRSFVCSREEFREFSDLSPEKKYDKLDTRCGCQTQVIFKVENSIYEIRRLIIEHNHPLIESSQRHSIRSACKIHDTSKGVIKSMVDAGIWVSKTYGYLLNEAGGYQSIGFTKRDCPNYIQVEQSKRIEAGDG